MTGFIAGGLVGDGFGTEASVRGDENRRLGSAEGVGRDEHRRLRFAEGVG